MVQSYQKNVLIQLRRKYVSKYIYLNIYTKAVLSKCALGNKSPYNN